MLVLKCLNAGNCGKWLGSMRMKVFGLSVMGVSCAELYIHVCVCVCVCVCVYSWEESTLLMAVSAKCLKKLHIVLK